jgi:hypothetical protein
MRHEHSKEEVEALLKSKDSNIVIGALIYSCFNNSDPDWVQEKCIDAIQTGMNEDIMGLGITCLSGRAQDALDDIGTFVK